MLLSFLSAVHYIRHYIHYRLHYICHYIRYSAITGSYHLFPFFLCAPASHPQAVQQIEALPLRVGVSPRRISAHRIRLQCGNVSPHNVSIVPCIQPLSGHAGTDPDHPVLHGEPVHVPEHIDSFLHDVHGAVEQARKHRDVHGLAGIQPHAAFRVFPGQKLHAVPRAEDGKAVRIRCQDGSHGFKIHSGFRIYFVHCNSSSICLHPQF